VLVLSHQSAHLAEARVVFSSSGKVRLRSYLGELEERLLGRIEKLVDLLQRTTFFQSC